MSSRKSLRTYREQHDYARKCSQILTELDLRAIGSRAFLGMLYEISFDLD
ncbi:MAG: hypothetical protein R3F19_16525 [Verrucomicrobiales bacterium]